MNGFLIKLPNSSLALNTRSFIAENSLNSLLGGKFKNNLLVSKWGSNLYLSCSIIASTVNSGAALWDKLVRADVMASILVKVDSGGVRVAMGERSGARS